MIAWVIEYLAIIFIDMTHHFLLTRFNIALWRHDKNGESIDRTAWLEERLELFERYCLPSVVGQTCQDFVWVMLVDAGTPEVYRERIKAYKEVCLQIKLVPVKGQYGFKFAEVFQGIVSEELEKRGAKAGDLCLTTYLDNDDCLNKKYVETITKTVEETITITKTITGLRGEVSEVSNFRSSEFSYFLVFDYGLQYYTELGLATRISYPNNHFMTCVESLLTSHSSLDKVRTCYGYGSHFFLEKNHAVPVHHIINKDEPMWIEVIHKDNVDNDVKMTCRTTVVDKSASYLQDEFSIDVPLSASQRMTFYLRYIKQMCRRGKEKILPRKW